MSAHLLSLLNDKDLLRSLMYINGTWTQGSQQAATKPVVNPANGEVIIEVATATRADVEHALETAEAAKGDWGRKTALERAAILRRWYTLIMDNVDDLATILTYEQGKPIGEAKGEIVYGAGFIEWFAEEAKRSYGETIPTNVPSRRLLTIRQPIGVTAAITPWNFPMAMIARKAAPALAAGCPMVIKPASDTPLSALAMAELAHRAGIPAGVLSVVMGSASMIADVITSSPIVRAVSFTGSTEVGRELMAACAKTVKKVAMELGGNAPVIIFDDADLDLAVSGTIASKFRNTGQTCVCANRIYVQAGIYDTFAKRLNEAVAAMAVGNGLEAEVVQGPLINDAAVAKVEEHIADAVAKGAQVTTGGQRHALGGYFFEPTVLVNATQDMMIASEETFGPVAALFKFETEDEAIRLANDSPFGLAAYFFTRDVSRMWRVGEGIEAGVVGVNTGLISYEGAPFGGVKESGVGREGSKHGLDEFTELKYICIGGIDQ